MFVPNKEKVRRVTVKLVGYTYNNLDRIWQGILRQLISQPMSGQKEKPQTAQIATRY